MLSDIKNLVINSHYLDVNFELFSLKSLKKFICIQNLAPADIK